MFNIVFQAVEAISESAGPVWAALTVTAGAAIGAGVAFCLLREGPGVGRRRSRAALAGRKLRAADSPTRPRQARSSAARLPSLGSHRWRTLSALDEMPCVLDVLGDRTQPDALELDPRIYDIMVQQTSSDLSLDAPTGEYPAVFQTVLVEERRRSPRQPTRSDRLRPITGGAA